MDEMSPLAQLFTYVFCISVMASIGLQVTGRQVVNALRDVSLMGRALIANLVLVPILGVVLVWLFGLPPDVAAALLILAVAPGAPLALQFTSKVTAALAFAAALVFVLTVVSLAITPLLAGMLVDAGTALALPVQRVAGQVAIYLLLPLLAGFALQRWAARVAGVLRRPMSLCASLSFPVMIVLTMAAKSAATRTIGGRALAAMLLLVLGGMTIGWCLGGPDTATRRVLAASTGMRNVMVALLIAITSFPDSDVDVAVLAFSALMVPPNLIFTVYHNLRARRRAAALGTAARTPA